MKELVFLLEEESAAEMLKGVLPRILPPEIIPRFITFEGKQDLEKQVTQRIRGYHNPLARFVVLRDQDSNPNCAAVKTKLVELCSASGRIDSLVRIACRELESFYLADLTAVERGLELSGLAHQQEGSKFRRPDYLGSPSLELKTLTKGRYQKIGGSRSIAPYLDLDNVRSTSFHNLIAGIRRVIQEMAA